MGGYKNRRGKASAVHTQPNIYSIYPSRKKVVIYFDFTERRDRERERLSINFALPSILPPHHPKKWVGGIDSGGASGKGKKESAQKTTFITTQNFKKERFPS